MNNDIKDELTFYVIVNPLKPNKEYVVVCPNEYKEGKSFGEYAKTRRVFQFGTDYSNQSPSSLNLK